MRNFWILFVIIISSSCCGSDGGIYKFSGTEKDSQIFKKGCSYTYGSAGVRLIGFTSDSVYLEMASIPEDLYHNKRIGVKGQIDTIVYFNDFYCNELNIDYVPALGSSEDSYLYADVSFLKNFK